MLKRYLIVSTCLLLGACSWWSGSNDTPQPAPVPKTIGVISALDGQIVVIDASNHGWARHTAFYPTTGWPIDDLAVKQADAWLAKRGFEVRSVTSSAGAFSPQALGGPVSSGGWFDRQRPSFTDIIHRSVQPPDLDYYLILVEASGSTGLPDLHGIGFIHFSHKPQAVVAYHAFLVDGKSGETLDDVHAEGGAGQSGNNDQIDAPNTDLPKAVWPQQVTNWSAEQQAAFRQAVEAELGVSLKDTLRRLDLP